MKVQVQTKRRHQARDRPRAAGSGSGLLWLTDQTGFDSLACSGYVRLSDSPDISAAVNTIARLVGSMPIHLPSR